MSSSVPSGLKVRRCMGVMKIGTGARGARLGDVAPQVLAVIGRRVGRLGAVLAVRIVVTELDEDELRFFRRGFWSSGLRR